MIRYIFSGGLTPQMAEYLKNMPRFEPIHALVTQLDRNSIDHMIKFMKEGVVADLFVDSGAFSVHTGKAKVDVDEYIDYVNSIDEYTCAIAQLDTIPGTFGKAKTPKDYEESAKKSWDNFLYMYSKLKSPEKLIPVFHYGESFAALKNMLDWKDKNGRQLSYLGISPANDTAQNIKNRYMSEVYDFIAKSANPSVHTHLFGMTSLEALAKYPAYSADSVSHRLQGAYNKMFVPEFGTISLSKKSRTSKSLSNQSFVDVADAGSVKRLEEYLAGLNLTIEQCQEEHSARCAVSMRGILDWLEAHPYKPENRVRNVRLF